MPRLGGAWYPGLSWNSENETFISKKGTSVLVIKFINLLFNRALLWFNRVERKVYLSRKNYCAPACPCFAVFA